MSAIPESAREVLQSGALAHLVTINPDGSPQVSCIWVGLEGEELVSAHLFPQQKLRNIERDPRVALSFEGTGANAQIHEATYHFPGEQVSGLESWMYPIQPPH